MTCGSACFNGRDPAAKKRESHAAAPHEIDGAETVLNLIQNRGGEIGIRRSNEGSAPTHPEKIQTARDVCQAVVAYRDTPADSAVGGIGASKYIDPPVVDDHIAADARIRLHRQRAEARREARLPGRWSPDLKSSVDATRDTVGNIQRAVGQRQLRMGIVGHPNADVSGVVEFAGHVEGRAGCIQVSRGRGRGLGSRGTHDE